MDFQAIDLSLNNFTKDDKAIIDNILSSVKTSVTPFSTLTSQGLLALVDAHKAEHGTSIGYIKDGYGNILGIAGLHFQPEAALYEIVTIILPEFKDRTVYIVEHLVFDAFSNLSMDKIFARTPVNTTDYEPLKENGFVCLGERAFAEGGRTHLWNYYELENEANLVSADEAGESHVTSDWDSLF